MGILAKPVTPHNAAELNRPKIDKVPGERDLFNNAPTLRWRSLFKAIRDAAMRQVEAGGKLPSDWSVIYTSEEPELATLTGTRVRKNAYRYMVPGMWELKSQKVFTDGVFERSELLARYVTSEDNTDGEVMCLPASRGPSGE